MTDRPFDQDDAGAGRGGARHFRGGPARPEGGRSRAQVVDPDDHEPVDDGYVYVSEEEYEELPPERSGARRVLIFLLVLLAVLALLAYAAFTWVQNRIDPPGPPGEAVTLEIPMGSTTEQIGELLAAEGVIASDSVWRWYVRWQGSGPFQAGRYEFRQNSHMDDAIEVLAAGPMPPDTLRFTVPEGYTVDQILARLADDERGLGLDEAEMRVLLEGGEIRSQYQPDDQPSPEGILFPETYEVDAEDGYDERSVLQMMVDHLDRTMASLDVEAAQERFNLTPYEILIVASLIERETRIDDERPMVARVIYNRLSQGIPLGIDATSCYEIEETPCVLRVSDLERDSPYNTRRNAGLVPTPIASPGRASIAAALEPADGPWIYYVLQDEEGNHFFTDSAAEFEQAKAVCRERGLGCG